MFATVYHACLEAKIIPLTISNALQKLDAVGTNPGKKIIRMTHTPLRVQSVCKNRVLFESER